MRERHRLIPRVGGLIVCGSREPSREVHTDPRIADLNHDCRVDLRDFAVFQTSIFGP